MKKLSFASLVFIMLCLAIATFVEDRMGTDFVSQHIYRTWWFVVLWAVLGISSAIYLIKQRTYQKRAVFLLHISLLVILAGALLTFCTGVQGGIHLRQGERKAAFIDELTRLEAPLPFTLSMDSFRVSYYAGTEAPADYVSYVKITDDTGILVKEISMNKILSYKRYRFCQTSFDQDGLGTFLSVNYDPWGIPVTYTGYFLLALSMVCFLLSKGNSFFMLLKDPRIRKLSFCLLVLFPVTLLGNPASIGIAEAQKLGEIRIMYSNRITPLQTLARDFTLKLTGKDKYKGLSAEQVLAGWIFYSSEWLHEPMILIKNKELLAMLGARNGTQYVTLSSFFTKNNEYRLASFWSELHHGGKQTPLIKAITEADEKVQLISMLQQGSLLTVFPVNNGQRIVWKSPSDNLPDELNQENARFVRDIFSLMNDAVQQDDKSGLQMMIDKLVIYQQKEGKASFISNQRMKTEIYYNRIDFSTWLYRANLVFGLLAFVFAVYQLLVVPPMQVDRKSWLASKGIPWLFDTLLLCSFLFHTVGIGMRTYIGGRFPMSNGYETMLFIAWSVLFTAILFGRRFRLLTAFAFLLSGFVLLVASLGQMNPQITPLMPVLLSPWLSIHVSLIMMSYALFGFMMLNGVTACILWLTRKKISFAKTAERIEALALVSRLVLYPATFFLGIGIFVGAVWANVSWGSYWSWDPKEVWALITFLVYAVPSHNKIFKIFDIPLFFHLYIILAFATVLMTYFGVNYLLGGMHSYAG